MDSEGVELDFHAVDQLGFAAARDRLNQVPTAFCATVRHIGPLLEVLHLQESGALPELPSSWMELGDLCPLRDAVRQRQQRWSYAGDAISLGMMRLAPEARSNEWTAFAMDAKRAAVAAGFTPDWAGQIVAAIREIEDNARLHSGAMASAYLAFQRAPGFFEFVVADGGVGVLATLREAQEYADLSSDGDALRIALTEGASRVGFQKGNGYGYRPLFIGLLNRRAALRFRSGAGALTMDGVSPALPTSRIAVKPAVRGLFVSVCCFAAS